MEVVIILGNIGEDAQPVWYPQRNHILCIQQGWDPQLLLRHSKCLEKEGKKINKQGSCPAQATELLLIRSKKLYCKQPHSNNNSTGEQLHQFNSYIIRPLQEPTESWLPATALRNSGREPKIWPGKLAVAHCTGTHLGFPISSSSLTLSGYAQLRRARPGRRGCISPGWQTRFQASSPTWSAPQLTVRR